MSWDDETNFEYKGFRINIKPDDNAESPRNEYDHFGVYHRKGDRGEINRLQQLHMTHPKVWKWGTDVLGGRAVAEFLGVSVEEGDHVQTE